VQVTDDGTGRVVMSWNFGHPQLFTAVTTTVIQAERARTDQFTFQLGNGNDTFTAKAEAARSVFQQPGPSTGSTGIDLDSHGPADSMAAHAHAHLTDLAHPARTRGYAVQSGTLLTVTVNQPGTNVVQVTNEGGGNVQVEWNGGMAHAFTGVETIMVDTHNARKDQVTLTDSIP
jgi:hypothetical protein